MKIYNLKSHAKINLTLNVIGKFSNKMHKIESIICFIDLADKIRISESKSNTHRIIFEGKFSKGIPRHNSVLKVLNLLDKNNSDDNCPSGWNLTGKFDSSEYNGQNINICCKNT